MIVRNRNNYILSRVWAPVIICEVFIFINAFSSSAYGESNFTFLTVGGPTNNPVAAIGDTGYGSYAAALDKLEPEETMFILRADPAIPDTSAILGRREMSFKNALASAGMREPILLPEYSAYAEIAGSGVSFAGMYPVTITYHGNGGKTASGEEKAEVSFSEGTPVVCSNDDEKLRFLNGELDFYSWNTLPDGSGQIIPPGMEVEPGTELYAVWGPVTEVYSLSGELKGRYGSLAEACEACEPRGKIKLLASVTDGTGAIEKIDRELLLDLNGKSVNGAYQLSEGETASKKLYIMKYGECGYQFRKQYNILYNIDDGSTSSTVTNSKYNSKISYREKDITIFNPTKYRVNSYGQRKKAAFTGWYRDRDLKDILPFHGDGITKTDVTVSDSVLQAVKAPEWPEDVSLYPGWMWAVSVHCNDRGFMTIDGEPVGTDAVRYFSEGAQPVIQMFPNEFYGIYRYSVDNYTVDRYKNSNTYIPSWYEKFRTDEYVREHGLMTNVTVVCTFALGFYNPATGDTGNAVLWLVICLNSLGIIAGLFVSLRKGKGR